MVLTHSLLYTHPRLPSARPATLQDYKAAMLLSGVGDALGYRNQLWEYNDSGPAIHQVGNLEITLYNSQEDGSLDPGSQLHCTI